MRTAAAVIALAAAADAFAPMPASVPRASRGALSTRMCAPESKLPSNLAKEGALKANKEQWGISGDAKAAADGDEGLKWILQPPETNPSERGTLRKETDTIIRDKEERAKNAFLSNNVPASKVPMNKAKMGALAANRETWGITEALDDDSLKWVLSPPVTSPPSERGELRKDTDTIIRDKEERAAAALAANQGPRSITPDELKALSKLKGLSREEAEPKLVALGYEGELLESVWGAISGPAWVLQPPQTNPQERGTLRKESETLLREKEERAEAAAAASQGNVRAITQDEVKALSKLRGMSREEAEPKLQALGYEGALLDKAWQEVSSGSLWLLQPPQTKDVERGTLRKSSGTIAQEREERAASVDEERLGGARLVTQDEVKALAKQFGRMSKEEAEPKLIALGYEGELLDRTWAEVSNFGAKWVLQPPQTNPQERGTLRKESDTIARERQEAAFAQSPEGRMDLAKRGALKANREQWGIEEPLKVDPTAADVPWLFKPPQTADVERGTLRSKK